MMAALPTQDTMDDTRGVCVLTNGPESEDSFMTQEDQRFEFACARSGEEVSETWSPSENVVGIFGIRNTKHGEWLIAGDQMLNEDRRHVSGWGGEGAPDTQEDQRWEIVQYDVDGVKAHYFGTRSVLHGEWLYCNDPMLEGGQRHVLTWAGDKPKPVEDKD